MNLPEIDPDYCIEKQIFRHSRKSNALYLTAALAVFVALLSLPFLYVDIVVHGVGVVRPITEKVELKAPVAETIVQVFAREGSRLQKGDTILLLNTTSVDAGLSNQRSLLSNISDQISDLKALCTLEKKAFRSEKRHQEYLLFLRQKEELALSLDAAERKLKRNEPLFRTGVIPQDEFENYQHEKQRFERELKTLQENRLSLWKSDLNDLQRLNEESLANLRRLEQERTQYALTAPVQGTLEQCAGLYPGGRVYSGQSIGVISPDSTLVVECYLPPKDIGFLHLSMKVSVLVEAFDYNQWGKLDGLVSDISSDFVLLNETPLYKVKCRIEKPF
ncbi:MAG: HlyD family efflux transporter periplasmic adaptor subunit, partial [Bacteroidia bacterium]|nr:HlyD family efflux transporter periplasmic adaptor subunit [Bacteroidia bacterium]